MLLVSKLYLLDHLQEAMFAHQYVFEESAELYFDANGHDLYFYVLAGAGSVTFEKFSLWLDQQCK